MILAIIWKDWEYLLAACHRRIKTTHCEGAGRNNETLSPLFTEGFVSVQYTAGSGETRAGLEDGEENEHRYLVVGTHCLRYLPQLLWFEFLPSIKHAWKHLDVDQKFTHNTFTHFMAIDGQT